MLGPAAALLAFLIAPWQQATLSQAEQLHQAVRQGKLAEVQSLISAGAPVDARDALGSTPLLDAAWSGELEIAAFLIQHGADVNAEHREANATPLHYAVLTGRSHMVRLLLDAGADAKKPYRDGQSLAHVAAQRGFAAVIEELARKHVDLEALDANGNTPLDIAVLHNQPLALEALLSNHVNASYVHAVDGRGPLHELCIRNYAEMLQPLIDAGADPTRRDKFGQTPLDIALAYKSSTVVAALLHLGQKLKESDKIAEEAMESATMRGQIEIARLLLENGLDVNRPLANGSRYLNDAALKGQTKMVKLLLDHGASVTARNQSGGTALHDAALGGNAEVVALLLDKGAPIDDRETESGATALMIGASLGRKEAVKVLLEKGANRDLRDKAGHTALERARDTEDQDIVRLLSAK